MYGRGRESVKILIFIKRETATDRVRKRQCERVSERVSERERERERERVGVGRSAKVLIFIEKRE